MFDILPLFDQNYAFTLLRNEMFTCPKLNPASDNMSCGKVIHQNRATWGTKIYSIEITLHTLIILKIQELLPLNR